MKLEMLRRTFNLIDTYDRRVQLDASRHRYKAELYLSGLKMTRLGQR